jgi:hypothetical protein
VPASTTSLRIPITTEVLIEVYGFRCDGCKVYCSLPCEVMCGGNLSMDGTTAMSCYSKYKKNILEFAADICNCC